MLTAKQKQNGYDLITFMVREVKPKDFDGGVYNVDSSGGAGCLICHAAKAGVLSPKIMAYVNKPNFNAGSFSSDYGFRKSIIAHYGVGAADLFDGVATECGNDYFEFYNKMLAHFKFQPQDILPDDDKTVSFTVVTSIGEKHEYPTEQEARKELAVLQKYKIDAKLFKNVSSTVEMTI